MDATIGAILVRMGLGMGGGMLDVILTMAGRAGLFAASEGLANLKMFCDLNLNLRKIPHIDKT